jgi:arylsulfatase A-like enzyme
MLLKSVWFRVGRGVALAALVLGRGLVPEGCAAPSPSALAAKQAEAPASGPARPNIVLILADDLDPNHLGAYGGDLPTPHTDRLAAGGMRFGRAYTSSTMRTPSRYAILTGQYAGRTRALRFLEKNPTDQPYRIAWNTPLTAGNLVVHEMLSGAGYFTESAGKYHMGKTRADLDLPTIPPGADPRAERTNRRLRAYQEGLREGIKERTGADAAASIIWKNYPDTPLDATSNAHSMGWTTAGTLRLLERAAAQEKPFFLSPATTALHGPGLSATLTEADPRVTPAGWFEEPYRHRPPRDSVRARLEHQGVRIDHYSAGMALLDDQIGAILDRLAAPGLTENTLVVFAADHGTEPGKTASYGQGAGVPLLARWPARAPAGTASSELVQLTDLWPAFAAVAGASPPGSLQTDGKSLRPLLRRPGAFAGRELRLPRKRVHARPDQRKAKVRSRFAFPTRSSRRCAPGSASARPNSWPCPARRRPSLR